MENSSLARPSPVIRRSISFLLVAVAVQTAVAGDWPMWGRTPGRNMVSDEKNLPSTFHPGEFIGFSDRLDLSTSRNVKWMAKLGSQSYGNATVKDGRVFAGTNNDGRRDPRFPGDSSLLKCLDEKTGQTLWTLTVPKLDSGKVSDWEYLGIASSACVDGDRVYIVTNRCEVVCLDVLGLSNGNQGFQNEGLYMAGIGQKTTPVEVRSEVDADILWRFDMSSGLGVFPHNITSTSLFVVGNKVFTVTSNGVDYSHKNIPAPNAPILAAFDKLTGALLGEEASGLSRNILHSSWASPAYIEKDGRGQVILGGPNGWLWGFDPEPIPDPNDAEFKIFKELWRIDANPLHYRYKDGDRSKPIKYARSSGPSEFIATPVVYRGKIYGAIGQDPDHGDGLGNLICVDPFVTESVKTHDGKTRKRPKLVWQFSDIGRSISTVSIVGDLLFIADLAGFIYCLDAQTAELYWKHDTLGRIWGSTLAADGKVYSGNEDGVLTVLAATKTYKLIGKVDLYDPIYSSPIAANGVLYVSTQTRLFAVEVSGEKGLR